MKKIFYFIIILIFIILINIFLKTTSDLTHIIGINLILAIYFFLSIGCMLIINKIFKKSNLNNSKNFKKDMKIAFANSFVTSSIFSIIVACIIYGFLKNILEFCNLKQGLINYCIFASKIWFISSPFIGLEMAVFKYFEEIDYIKKSIVLLCLKLLIFVIISFLYYETRKSNCFIYAKPICDIIFLIYYSKICFDITIKS